MKVAGYQPLLTALGRSKRDLLNTREERPLLARANRCRDQTDRPVEETKKRLACTYSITFHGCIILKSKILSCTVPTNFWLWSFRFFPSPRLFL